MFDGGLDEDHNQVVVLKHRAGRQDRSCDLDLIQRQHVDERVRGPVGLGQPFCQNPTHIPFDLVSEHEKDFAQDLGEFLGRRVGFAQGGDGEEQSLPIVARPAARQGEKVAQMRSLGFRGPRRGELDENGHDWLRFQAQLA